MNDELDQPLRKIIHVDMDAFFASVEQRDDPSLRGRPVAVGGGSFRGVVAAASYEARQFGVRSAMASVTARRRCPDLVFVQPRFDVYREVSQQIRAIFSDYTPLVEPLSLDEAYLDVTKDLKGIGIATRIAEEIRARIQVATALTASAGVSYNKFLAKLASDENKPDGLCVIAPGRGAAFVAGLPVSRFHGVGPKTAAKMARLGIVTGADLAAQPEAFLERQFGSAGPAYFRLARGICHRSVRANRTRKSMGAEDTFPVDLTDPSALRTELARIAETIWSRIGSRPVAGRTVVLKMKYSDFRIVTRSASLGRTVTGQVEFLAVGCALLDRLLPVEQPVRLLGLTLTGLTDPTCQQEDTPVLLL